jgi:hypothetical protein
MSGQARMLDGYIVSEQDRAALQWLTSCASDDALKRQIDAQLSAGPLPSVAQARRGSLKRAAPPLRAVGRAPRHAPGSNMLSPLRGQVHVLAPAPLLGAAVALPARWARRACAGHAQLIGLHQAIRF